MTKTFLLREDGKDVFSISVGVVVAIQRPAVWLKLGDSAVREEWDIDDFSPKDLPRLKVGARVRVETGRNRTISHWGSYVMVSVLED
jgi:hypothetical protein